ncbi:MerR family transcriptional regulator [Actinomadura decatromicini]|uniref:MerR family transcriptional regulator n=1 Tax=Actinomadura decatromicini TaxID=2604572 RepID=A0A5D3FQ57_9ACTN|nr:MerR family transcriptional regulator [Actinomadura decatromicini]TYK50481.1 MerR family transcriptional regulator [Actinomadura decatromicini]
MRISDAAAAAGTTPRALRFYEQRGLLPPPDRTAGGQRRYGPAEVRRVRTIRMLLSMGLTVEDLRLCADRLHLLDENDGPPPSPRACGRGSGVARRRLDALDAEIARLTGQRERLAARVGLVPQD